LKWKISIHSWAYPNLSPQIFDVNLGTLSPEMRLVGSVSTKDCFHSVAWGAKGIDVSDTHIFPAFFLLLFAHFPSPHPRIINLNTGWWLEACQTAR
jgi:hypothetical protein